MEEKFPYTYKREKQRFSIRKIKAWGACSVFLGTSILFLSAGTVARADTTADATVNTGSASKNPTVPVTSTDNSKKIKSLLVSNHLEEKDNLENVALSSNSVQPATSISDDTYLKKLGIDINDLNTNSVLKLASLFHIFANQASLSADTNGNLAVKILNGSNDFGTRGDSYNLTSGDIYYIQQLDKNLQSNAFRNITFNHVVLGKDVNVSIENNKVLINGITMDNLKPEDVYQDTTGQTYIDFSDVFQQLISSSTSYTSTTQSKGVNSNYSDMNNRYIDVSGVAAGTQIIYVNVPFEYLSDPQPITIKGISNSLAGPTIVINVTGIPDGNQNISTQVQFNYIHGTNPLPNSEGHKEPNHVLWNLGTGGQTFNFSSGRFMGSILAPNATINAGVNIDGNIVANIVNITGGESHRWDIHPQPTQPTKPVNPSQPTTPTKPVNPSQPTTPTKPVNPSQPTTPTKPVNPSQPTTPTKPVNPSQPTTPTKPVNPSQPTTPTQPMTHGTTQTTESKTINEIIHYVYKDGTTAHDDYVAKPVKFTREVSTDAVTGEKTYGPWTADQSFATVTSPAIKGYTPDQAEIGSQTVSGDSSDLEFTVVYAKNAPTKPVNPSQPTTPTKPVNPSQPTTPTKPVNPSQPTTPTKPVNPSQPTTPTKPVNPSQPTTPTKPVNPSQPTTPTKPVNPSQPTTPTKPVNPSQPTKPVNPSQPTTPTKPVNPSQPTTPTKPVNPSQPTTPTQPMTHGTTQTTESKTINEIIHYVYKDGTTAHDDYVAKPVKFTREVSTDAVTGEKTYGPWTADQSFATVTSPAIKGYTPDQAEIGSQTVSGDSSDLEFTVVYAKNAPTKPVNPSQPTTPTKPVNPSQPTTPTKPVNPSQPTTPTNPVNPSQPTTPTNPVNPSQPTTPTNPVNPSQPTTPTKPVQAGQAAATNFMNQWLPQTGETDQQHMTLSGLLLLAMSSLLGLFGMTKRQRKE